MSRLGSNALAGKWRSGFGLGCVSGVIVAVLVLAVLGAMVRRGPERFPGPVRSLYGADGTVVTASGAASLSLEQIRAIRGVQPTVQVTLTEADINSYLRENPDEIGLPKGFRNPRVRFTEGRVRLLVSTRVVVFSTRIEIAMEPRVEGGELRLEVKKIEAGGVSLPGELRKIAESQVASLLTDRLGEAGLQPESVEVGEGKLTVSARLVPVEAPAVEADREGSAEE
ncbi:MAG: LmeA family phospholipid-binding protein [Armatimonadota bacterium]|jgi:hypothetical protein